MPDWMPAREQDLVDLCVRWMSVITDAEKQTACGWDPAECAATAGAITAFFTARSVYKGDNSTENRIAKDAAQKTCRKAMRDFANSSVRFNKKMTAAEKAVMGVNEPDSTRTSHDPPGSQPETLVENTAGHYEHRVRAIKPGGGSGKPADAYGVRYAWQVGGERPPSGGDLPKTRFSRKTSCVVAHTEEDKGKTAWYSTCYENSKGEQGIWSPVVEAVIG